MMPYFEVEPTSAQVRSDCGEWQEFRRWESVVPETLERRPLAPGQGPMINATRKGPGKG